MVTTEGKVPPEQGNNLDMNEAAHATALPTDDGLGSDVARQYAQYVELAGIARLVSDEACWDEGTSSTVSSFVVGYATPST
jgi:hypothetical protein